jgi:hypothetical protein
LTGTDLAAVAALRRANKLRVFAMNNTFEDYKGAIDVFTACDPAWWTHYGERLNEHKYQSSQGSFEAWHWDEHTCKRWGLYHVPGKWGDGLSLDPSYIHYGHSSSYQLLNLAVLYGCTRILLLGFDMSYPRGKPRHYFNSLSEHDGEYPAALRKWSSFTGLLACFKTIAEQAEKLRTFEIINCTPMTAMSWFPIRRLEDIEL